MKNSLFFSSGGRSCPEPSSPRCPMPNAQSPLGQHRCTLTNPFICNCLVGNHSFGPSGARVHVEHFGPGSTGAFTIARESRSRRQPPPGRGELTAQYYAGSRRWGWAGEAYGAVVEQAVCAVVTCACSIRSGLGAAPESFSPHKGRVQRFCDSSTLASQ